MPLLVYFLRFDLGDTASGIIDDNIGVFPKI